MADACRSRRARTTEDGGAGRCLSDLSDDLLQHILFLAPDREGASTAVLSRRWRWLWRTSGAVYLDSRSFNDGGCSSRENFFFLDADRRQKDLADKESEAFLRGAEKALAAAAAAVAAGHGPPIRRLTFFVAEDSKIILLKRWWPNKDKKMEHNLMEALVSNPAARRVEELHIVVRALNTRFTLSFGSLPSDALRVLRIVRCSTLTAGAGAALRAFPMLVDLHLENCSVSLVDLQRIIDAAPLLSKLHLASSYFSKLERHEHDDAQQLVGRLLMPAVSALVLADCSYGYKYVELDVPRLQYFRYRGLVESTDRFSLKSQGSAIHVDLHFTHDVRNAYSKGPTSRELFWRFIHSFSNTTKLLKLRMDFFLNMGGLAFVDKASREELLGGLSFNILEQLELEAGCNHGFELFLADLLHCCPMVRDLRIKLIKKHPTPWMTSKDDNINEAGVQFDRSVSGFSDCRRNRSMVSLDSSMETDEDNYQNYCVIPDLTDEKSCSCLQSHLKRVSLHFFMDEPNCLGVKLAKFFAENAMVLQELHIDDGSQEMLEHVNSSVRRWIPNNTDKTVIT